MVSDTLHATTLQDSTFLRLSPENALRWLTDKWLTVKLEPSAKLIAEDGTCYQQSDGHDMQPTMKH